jgi:hypothetical protein
MLLFLVVFMQLLTLTPQEVKRSYNQQVTYSTEAGTDLATVNGAFITWHQYQNADVLVGGALKDIGGGANGWGISGGTSNQQITSGDGYVEFAANVPLSTGFAGRAFFAGLTVNALVTEPTHVQFALQVTEFGVSVFEGGVNKGTFRTSRNNAIYRVAIEEGAVVYRVDGDLIYRSDQQVTYPLRFGAIFYHRNIDRIGGLVTPPESFVSFSALYPDGSPVPNSFWSFNIFTVPDVRGRFKITALTDTNVFATAYVDAQRVFPGQDIMPCPTQFIELIGLDDWRVNEQVNDDLSAVYNLASNNKIKRWRFTWNKLPRDKAELLDAFFEDHRGKAFAFYFFDYRTATIYDNVRFSRYDKDHRFIHLQKRVVELIHRPK